MNSQSHFNAFFCFFLTHPQSFSMGRTKLSYLIAYGLGQAIIKQLIYVRRSNEKLPGEVLTQVILHQSCENTQLIMSRPHGIPENLARRVDTHDTLTAR